MSGKRKIRKKENYLFMYVEGEIAYRKEEDSKFEEGEKVKVHKYEKWGNSNEVGVGKRKYSFVYDEHWETVEAISVLENIIEEDVEDDEQE